MVWALAVLGLTTTAAQAEIYKWTDESGQTHYSSTPPPEQKKQAQKLELNTRVPGGGAMPPSEKDGKLLCGSLILPADRLDPMTNIAMYREAIAIWQKYIDENYGKSDEATLQGIKDRRCAIAYANDKLRALSDVEQDLQNSYQRVTDELEELQEQVAQCSEEGEMTPAQCKQQHQSRIKELETMKKRLEGPSKVVRPAE